MELFKLEVPEVGQGLIHIWEQRVTRHRANRGAQQTRASIRSEPASVCAARASAVSNEIAGGVDIIA